MSKYLPRDYIKVPWETRPLAMKVLESHLGQPIEEVIVLSWFTHRNLRGMCKTLSLENTTLRRWMRGLGLLICADCSKSTGRLHAETFVCPGCPRYFCDECMERHPPEHFV